uniref:F-box domain-containing protein n=1 Tax=Brassica campestris TaxID=3711 RepID=M4F4M9_BRACM
MSNSNADEPPENYTTHPPPPPSLSSLPDEIVLRCLARVPRSYHLSLSWVSKNLKALVRSLPELNGQRSILHKRSSLYLCFQQEYNDSSFHWFTLCPTEETSTTEYQLLSNSTPFPPHKYGSSTVAVGSNIFFIGRSRRPSSDLWILDTRSGNMTQGPSMSVPRNVEDAAVGVIDGKIYVIGGGGYHEEIQVEVFHPKSETWELAGIENMRTIPRSSASVEGKVYMVEYEKTSVYNPRECEGQRLVKIVSERLSERGRKETVPDTVERSSETSEFQTVKHPIESKCKQVVDKTLIKERPAPARHDMTSPCTGSSPRLIFNFKSADDWLKDAGNEAVYRSVILNKMTTMCL